jgi:hypothetical protein
MELTARNGRSQYAERPSGLKIAGELKASSAPDADASGQPAAGMFDCERSRKEPKHLLRVGHTHVDRRYWNPQQIFSLRCGTESLVLPSYPFRGRRGRPMSKYHQFAREAAAPIWHEAA